MSGVTELVSEVSKPEGINKTGDESYTKADPEPVKKSELPPLPYSWMVKPCRSYKEEYKDCKSFKDRFNQYFIDGKLRNCSQWKEDYENCNNWETTKDISAFSRLIESEKQRSRERLKAHFDNDVWEHRERPPEDWDKELPDSILEEYKGTFLQFKANEIKEGNIDLEMLDTDTNDNGRGWCTIM